MMRKMFPHKLSLLKETLEIMEEHTSVTVTGKGTQIPMSRRKEREENQEPRGTGETEEKERTSREVSYMNPFTLLGKHDQ